MKMNNQQARKILFDISRKLSENDIKAMNFFLRSDIGTGKDSSDIFDLLRVLEQLAYFTIKDNHANFDKLIELFKLIDRIDLQKELRESAKKLRRKKHPLEADVEIDSTQKATTSDEENDESASSGVASSSTTDEEEENDSVKVASSQKATSGGGGDDEENNLVKVGVASSQKITTGGKEENNSVEVASSQKTTVCGKEENNSVEVASSQKTTACGKEENNSVEVASSQKTTACGKEENNSVEVASSQKITTGGKEENNSVEIASSQKTTTCDEEENNSVEVEVASSQKIITGDVEEKEPVEVGFPPKTTTCDEEENNSVEVEVASSQKIITGDVEEKEPVEVGFPPKTTACGKEENNSVEVASSQKTTTCGKEENNLVEVEVASSQKTTTGDVEEKEPVEVGFPPKTTACDKEEKEPLEVGFPPKTTACDEEENNSVEVEVASSQKITTGGKEENNSVEVASSQKTTACGKEENNSVEVASSQKTTTCGKEENNSVEVASSQKTTTCGKEENNSVEVASSQKTTTCGEDLNNVRLDLAKNSTDPNNRDEATMNEGSGTRNNSFQQDPSLESEEQMNDNKEITLYNYQIELAEHAKTPGQNSIICSPTGSGKTITAASVIKHHLELAQKDKRMYRVLYLVHIRYLVKHLATDLGLAQKNVRTYRILYLVHIRYLVKHLAIDLEKILGDKVHSFGDDEFIENKVVRKKVVVILTAQILVNALESKLVKFSDYDLLVIDECHHTVHKHPYNEIMKRYHEARRENNKVPQILGLSATIGSGSDPFKTIVDICANMCTFWVSCVRDENNLQELEAKNQVPIIDEVISCKARTNDPFSKIITEFMKNYIIVLESKYDIKFDEAYEMGTTELESFLSQLKKECEKKELRTETKIIELLYIMNKAMIYYSDLTALYVMEYLDENIIEPEPPCQDIERKMYDHYVKTKNELEAPELEDKLENNDKLVKLKELLTKILKPDPEKKVLLLCLTRFNAVNLKKIFQDDKQLKKFVKTDYIIGQSGDNGLTQKQQVNVLKRFESPDLNLLISTSISQEGLNIPDCEIVIRYEYVTSEVSRVQAKGRARKKESKHYLIVTENSSSISRDIRNKQREEEMKVALEKVTETGQEEFEKEVNKRINELYKLADEKKRLDKSKYRHESDSVKIFCKSCHTELCNGSEIIKKGSDYICVNKQFPQKINKKINKAQEFRFDSNIGNSQCTGPQCSNVFGAIKKYKRGERLHGYVLGIKSILFQVQNENKYFLNKWSERTFTVKEEPL